MRFTYLLPAFLYTLLSSSSLTATQPSDPSINTNTTVLDIEGHELQSSTKYYTFPVESPNRGGGLTLASKDGTCPYYVMQESFESYNGLPLRFLTIDNKQKAIGLSTDLNIAFFGVTTCVQSTVWRVGGVSEVTGRRYVRSGGVVGRPGGETVSNWFRIVKDGSGNGYKIIFCPSVCGSCKVVCGDVGVFYEDGKRWLGLSDEPLLVMFKKI